MKIQNRFRDIATLVPRTLGLLRGSTQLPTYQIEVEAYENTYLLSFYLQEVNEPIGSK